MIASFSESETWDPADDREISKVLPSSTDIVIYFKKSLTRCNSIANGQSFYDLHKVCPPCLERARACVCVCLRARVV